MCNANRKNLSARTMQVVAMHAQVNRRCCHGTAYLAKRAARAFSLSPTYLLKSSGPLTDMKFSFDSEATALASNVLLHPGGPWSSTPAQLQKMHELAAISNYEGHSRAWRVGGAPLGGITPSRFNASGFLNGSSTASFSCCLTSSSPPMSSQVTCT